MVAELYSLEDELKKEIEKEVKILEIFMDKKIAEFSVLNQKKNHYYLLIRFGIEEEIKKYLNEYSLEKSNNYLQNWDHVIDARIALEVFNRLKEMYSAKGWNVIRTNQGVVLNSENKES